MPNPAAKSWNFRNLLLIIIFSLLYLLFGWWSFQQSYKEIATEWMTWTQSMASAINPDRLLTLHENSEDKKTSDYVRLREQLYKMAEAGKSLGVRWLYTMKVDERGIVFAVDSIPEEVFGHSEPGDIYQGAPPELLKSWDSNTVKLSAPYQDEWGKFVSIFIPLHDFTTGQKIALLGMDVNYQDFILSILHGMIPFLSSTAIFLVVLITWVWFARVRSQQLTELSTSEAKFSTLAESVKDIVIMMDGTGKIILWNNAAEQIIGYSRKEALGKNLHELIVPEGAHDWQHSLSLAQFGQTGKSSVIGKIIELDIVTKSKQKITIELSVSPINIANEWHAIGIMRDITNRKKIELQHSETAEELAKQHEAMLNVLQDVTNERTLSEERAQELAKFKLAVEHVSEHIVITDPEGIILYANPAVYTITGYALEEVIGKKAGSPILWGGQMSDEVYRKFWNTIKVEKKPYVGEFNNHRKNGEKYIAETHVSPILNSSGEVAFFVGIERDITHAKEVDRMKTEFISLASHQLRTPLSAMKWFLEMLLAGDLGKLTSEQHDAISNVDQSNERMISLVNALLNISRIESGRIIVEPELTDLNHLINQTVEEVKPKYVAKQQTLLVSNNPDLEKISVDPRLISEVILNLLTNAIKYTPEKGQICLSLTSNDTDVTFQVSDNGYGIPEPEQGKIFERFFRASNVTSKETDGTGLGLYLAKAIVESSGGKIWLKSKVGEGSSFFFTIPKRGMLPRSGEVRLS